MAASVTAGQLVILPRGVLTTPWGRQGVPRESAQVSVPLDIRPVVRDQKFEAYGALGAHAARQAVCSLHQQELEATFDRIREIAAQRRTILYRDLITRVGARTLRRCAAHCGALVKIAALTWSEGTRRWTASCGR